MLLEGKLLAKYRPGHDVKKSMARSIALQFDAALSQIIICADARKRDGKVCRQDFSEAVRSNFF
ncbi:hypothetical protein PQR62_03140 [Herbaspirillum lusitanum]|uniref:Uncharacterized protein n=1 Tax=Herbaspirillum lusitanum TaxID=213312 RepID=A0ABW9A332_9BURK